MNIIFLTAYLSQSIPTVCKPPWRLHWTTNDHRLFPTCCRGRPPHVHDRECSHQSTWYHRGCRGLHKAYEQEWEMSVYSFYLQRVMCTVCNNKGELWTTIIVAVHAAKQMLLIAYFYYITKTTVNSRICWITWPQHVSIPAFLLSVLMREQREC